MLIGYDYIYANLMNTNICFKYSCAVAFLYVYYEMRESLGGNGDIILLMDDVTTTGNSLYACREILLQNGAEHVEMFALGKAI